MLEGQVYLLFALHVVFSGAQHIYQPQNECSIQDCETILRDIRKDIVELKHSVEQLQSIKESESGMCSNDYSSKPNEWNNELFLHNFLCMSSMNVFFLKKIIIILFLKKINSSLLCRVKWFVGPKAEGNICVIRSNKS